MQLLSAWGMCSTELLLSFVAGISCVEVVHNANFHAHRRKHFLSERLPLGFKPYTSTADGNCLFSSVSVCLFGDTTHKTELRLATLTHGVEHMSHYLDMVHVLHLHTTNIICFCYHNSFAMRFLLLKMHCSS